MLFEINAIQSNCVGMVENHIPRRWNAYTLQWEYHMDQLGSVLTNAPKFVD